MGKIDIELVKKSLDGIEECANGCKNLRDRARILTTVEWLKLTLEELESTRDEIEFRNKGVDL